jgi:hypothetical protein
LSSSLAAAMIAIVLHSFSRQQQKFNNKTSIVMPAAAES